MTYILAKALILFYKINGLKPVPIDFILSNTETF